MSEPGQPTSSVDPYQVLHFTRQLKQGDKVGDRTAGQTQAACELLMGHFEPVQVVLEPQRLFEVFIDGGPH